MPILRFNGLDPNHPDPAMAGRPYSGRGGSWNAGDERLVEGHDARALLADFGSAFEVVDADGMGDPAPAPPAPVGLTVAQVRERRRRPNRPTPSAAEAAAPPLAPEASAPEA